MATFATPCVSACMLLLAPELIVAALCIGTAGSELKPFNTINGVNVAEPLCGRYPPLVPLRTELVPVSPAHPFWLSMTRKEIRDPSV